MTLKISSHVAYATASTVFWLAVGCSSPEPNVGSVGATSPTTDSTDPKGTSNPGGASETTCDVDADCAVVETECCDHCNGGKVEAYRKELADAHKKPGCEQTACTEMACGQATAACKDHVCTVVIQPIDRPPVGS